MGEFALASDSVIPTFSRDISLSHIIDQIPITENEAFDTITYTIGGMMVFPQNRINGKMTINGARGFHPRIKDRFDLTLECIRLHYEGRSSPLAETLGRYADFFELFVDFKGYVDFFLLQDLVSHDYASVKFHIPFKSFDETPLPKDRAEYLRYKQSTIAFIKAREQRMLAV